jgi:hypothetical protein
MQQINLSGGGIAYYVYDGSGQRIRKVFGRTVGKRRKNLPGGFIV